jgi:formate dehydrogenase major subunit
VVGYRFAMAASDHRRPHRRPQGQHRHRPLDRLTEPLVREGGILRPATWDEALGRAASGFASARADGGSIGVFSCSKSTNEMNFVAQKLARVAFGTNNIDSCNRT